MVGNAPISQASMTGLGRLENRRILITGGSSGIGLATARLFRAEGAAVSVLDVAPCPDEGCISVIADVSDEQAVHAAVGKAVQEMGGLDGLVNGVGIRAGFNTLMSERLQDWRKVIDINLTGSFIVMQAALPHLLQAAGNVTVVNICSGIALRPSAGQGGYAASKAGLLALTRTLAQEVGPGIRVNAVCPGATDTPFASGSDHAQISRVYVLGRVSRPEEQAQVILFLTSAESSFMTGAALAVDGGRTFH